MLFQASRAVTASNEMSRFISVSEYAPPSPSFLILACIETLGANSGANQLARGWDKRTRPMRTVLFAGEYLAKDVTLSLALRSSGDAGRGSGRG
jgi:hypothetical protein